MRHHQPLLSYGSTVAVFAGTPTFYAPLTNTLVPTTATGSATATYSVSGGVGSVMDWEGMLRITKAGEARFTGARRVENLLVKPELLTDAAWSKAGVSVTGSVTDPLGGSTAFTVTATGANGELYQTFLNLTGPPTLVGSLWIRRRTGTGAISLYAGTLIVPITAAVTSSWQRVTASGVGGATVYFDLRVSVSGDAVDVWHPLFENTSGQSNQNPGEYVSVGVLSAPWHGANVDGVKYFATKNGNTVASNVITEATGAAITTASGGYALSTDASGPFGLLVEYAQSYSGNVTTENAFNSWGTKSNLTITEKTAVAPNGETMAAALVENAVTGSRELSNFGSVSSLTTIVQSCFMKAGIRSIILMRLTDVSSNFVDTSFDLSNGTISIAQAATGTAVVKGAGIIAYPNGWYRIWQACTLVDTSAGVAFKLYPNNGSSYTGSNGSTAFYVWGAMCDGSSDFKTMPRSYAQGSRGPDFLSYVFASNASATAGTAYAETLAVWATTAPSRSYLIAFGIDAATPTAPLYVAAADAATTLRIADGTTSTQKTGGSDLRTAVRKVASSWTGATQLITIGGGAAQSGTFDGNLGSTAIGIGQPTTFGSAWGGHIRNVKLFTVAATAAELAGLTT